jgi:hypothetical protein
MLIHLNSLKFLCLFQDDNNNLLYFIQPINCLAFNSQPTLTLTASLTLTLLSNSKEAVVITLSTKMKSSISPALRSSAANPLTFVSTIQAL